MARRFGKSGFGGKVAGAGAASRASLYDEVTATIVAQLEAGVFPWVKPWSASAADVGLPRNAVTGRSYSGINVLILWGAVI
jgi:antirestriction protein ArdC